MSIVTCSTAAIHVCYPILISETRPFCGVLCEFGGLEWLNDGTVEWTTGVECWTGLFNTLLNTLSIFYSAIVCCKHVSGHIRAHLAMRAGGYHYSLFHYFTSAYPVQFEHFLDKPQTGW